MSRPGPQQSAWKLRSAPKRPPLDFTPLLAQVRANHARTRDLLGHRSLVLCLASRAQISLLVGSSDHILGAATTELEGLALVGAHQPDLLIVSDRLEAGCGIALVLAVRSQYPRTRILLLISQERRRSHIQGAIDAGCHGILLEAHLGLGGGIAAIRSVCAGGVFIDHALDPQMRHSGSDPLERPLQSLSTRELEVLARLVRGESNAEIAGQLYVSIDTVKTHIRNVLMKLPARDRTHAAVVGLRLGLVDWPTP